MQRYPLKTRRKYIKPLWTISLNDINTAAKFVRLVCFGRKACSYAGILSLKKQALQKQRNLAVNGMRTVACEAQDGKSATKH